jgi:hypothetical protein
VGSEEHDREQRREIKHPVEAQHAIGGEDRRDRGPEQSGRRDAGRYGQAAPLPRVEPDAPEEEAGHRQGRADDGRGSEHELLRQPEDVVAARGDEDGDERRAREQAPGDQTLAAPRGRRRCRF